MHWTREGIDEVFDSLYNELGRLPTETEFRDYGGVIKYIRDGRYDSGITSYNQYVEFRGLMPRPAKGGRRVK